MPGLLPSKKRKPGNPNWGRPLRSVPESPTEFDKEASRLGLTPETYVSSAKLREWCERHKEQFYIPEWLLKAWGMAEDTSTNAA